MARLQTSELYELSNEALAIAARDKFAHDVHQERLIRNIMAVDGIEYDDAQEKMKEMFKFNSLSHLALSPYDIGLFTAAIASFSCVPLVFDIDAATTFATYINANFDEVPTNKSFASIGAWSWDWMEPLLGTASFSILCLQLLRSQMEKMVCRCRLMTHLAC